MRTSIRPSFALALAAVGAGLALTVSAPASARAQAMTLASLRGAVQDKATRQPLADVDVGLYRGDSLVRVARTDAKGRFALDGLAPGEGVVKIRRLGFQHQDVSVTVADGVAPMTIELDPSAAAKLDSVIVEADPGESLKLKDYRMRKASKKQGIFMERADFPKNIRYLSEALIKVPGVQVRAANVGNGVRLRNCRPLLFVDGIKMDGAELDDAVSLPDVAAIEVYASLPQAPPQYQDRDSRCGSILVWLR